MNYRHLFYFWKVATCGGVIRAAEALHTTPQTLSGQIKQLEERLGRALFRKEGRRLVLTDAGQMTLNYAGEIFSLGAELQELLGSDQLDGLPTEYRVGINDALPNSIVQHLLAPLRMLDLPVRLLCREWEMQHLLAELGTHRLDLVLADTPIPVGFSVKAYSHRLGASPMAFFAAPPLAARCTALFPHCLHGLPFLLLTKESGVREQFEQWAHAQGLRPRIQAEFDDSGLMKTCGRAGWGVFMAPRVLAQEICRDYAVQMIGASAEIEQAYYAISVQRRITHPCTEAILRAAREGLFMLSGD